VDIDAIQQRPTDPLLVATFTPAAQVQERRGSPQYPQGYGFIAAMATKASQPAQDGTVRIRGVAVADRASARGELSEDLEGIFLLA